MRSARYLYVPIMGTWMGAAGIEHRVVEFLQGNIVPDGLMIQSRPHSAFFHTMNGEPALTILPNLHPTGLLEIGFSLVFAVSVIFFAQRKHGGWILTLLVIPMLLFGGGIFPPILGMLICAASMLPSRLPQKPTGGVARFIGLSWWRILAACSISWLGLFPGIAVPNYFFGFDSVPFTLVIMVTSFFMLFLAYLSSIQHDRLMNAGIKKMIRKPSVDLV